VLHPILSNQPSFASLTRDLRDNVTYTIWRRSSVSFETKLENHSPTCFTMKQATECRRVSSHRLYLLIDFEAQADKPHPPDFEAQTKKPSRWFWCPNHQTIAASFEAQTRKHMLLVSSTCMMQITNGVTQPPDRAATEYLTCVWSSLILRTKSPTSASTLVVARHVAFTTYTSRDKQTCFSTPNNSIWVSSTKMHRIQIQTKPNQLLITQINQGTNHLISQER
jgi:hypothetical protein